MTKDSSSSRYKGPARICLYQPPKSDADFELLAFAIVPRIVRIDVLFPYRWLPIYPILIAYTCSICLQFPPSPLPCSCVFPSRHSSQQRAC